MNTVRIYDFDTKTTTEIPADELAPGYVLAITEGKEGEFYVDASKTKSSPAYRHPPFTDPRELAVFKFLFEELAEVRP